MVPFATIFIYLLLGAFAGLLGGMLGVGGGVVVVPGLLFIFEWLGIFDDPLLPNNSLVLFAVGTSMASIIFTTGTASLVHYRRKSVDLKLVKVWVPFLVLGAIVASIVAEYIPGQYHKTIVASVLFIIAVILLLNWLPKTKSTQPPKWIPYTVTTGGGFMCGLVGQGGGNVVVPSLLAYKTPVPQATSTASIGALCVSLFATIGYMIAGFDLNVSHSLGYVYLPALIPIVLMSIVCAPIGVMIGQRLSKLVFVRIFGILMMIVSLRMYYTIFLN